MSNIKYMDIKEFRESGFLQEANRLFFHPHGLALEIVVEEDGTEHLGGIWDYRDDPEGIWYDWQSWNEDALAEQEPWSKYETVLAERTKHREHRQTMLSERYGIPTGDIEPILNKDEDGSEGQQKRTVS